MARVKSKRKIQQDSMGLILIVLVIIALMLAVVLYLHASERQEIRKLRYDLSQEIEKRQTIYK